MLARADEAVAAVRAIAGGVRGELHVGYAPSLTVQILPRALRKFQAEFPGVRVSLHDLSTEEMLAGVRDGMLDLTLIVEPAREKMRGFRFEELARFSFCVAVAPSHRLAKNRALTLAKIAAEPLITYTRADYPEYHTSLAEIFASLGRAPAIAGEHDSVSSLIAAVEAGRGIALIPSSMACFAGPRLRILPLTPATPPIIVGALYREETTTLAVQEFIAAARPEKADRSP